MYKGIKHSFSIGEVSAVDAQVYKATSEKLLGLLKQQLVDLRGHTVEHYLFHKGNPPETSPAAGKGDRLYTLENLRDNYLSSAARKLEANTLMVARCHFRHLIRILGPRQQVKLFEYKDLQNYVEQRSGERSDPPIAAETIRKEIKTLRTAWNWARRPARTGIRGAPNYSSIIKVTMAPGRAAPIPQPSLSPTPVSLSCSSRGPISPRI